jgi:hypothetical protein
MYGLNFERRIVNNILYEADGSDKTKLNSVVLVCKRTIPTEWPQPASEVSANFSW